MGASRCPGADQSRLCGSKSDLMLVQYKNLSLRNQLWIWAAVCIAPALTIGLMLYSQISISYQSSQRELTGLRYIRVVWDVVAMLTDVAPEGNQADRARVLEGRLQAAASAT